MSRGIMSAKQTIDVWGGGGFWGLRVQTSVQVLREQKKGKAEGRVIYYLSPASPFIN